MQIVVTGGTGFIGRPLCAALCQEGHRVTLLTRRVEAQRPCDSTVTVVEWNGREAGDWEQCFNDADAVLNLAGAPVAGGRWSDARKALPTGSNVSAAPMPSSIWLAPRLRMVAGTTPASTSSWKAGSSRLVCW